MTIVREKKRKLILVSVTFALCITIMLSGTFAWSSISQTALNETMGEMTNPGGRLHDDFNGSNKDIYVENFTDNENGMPIIVRIRLFEYMETGDNAGDKNNRQGVTILTQTDDGGDADINDPATWDLYKPEDTASNNHYGYWSWDLSGGKTVYMPTANKDKDSLESDRNGTYEGKPDTSVPFDDYKLYQVGDVSEDGTRTAVETIDGTVMSMAYWVATGAQLGNYWVYDTDGWAYWANPLQPQEATGLLLSKISHSKSIDKKWYYAIYVECQMVTADEIFNMDSAMENHRGFYWEHNVDKHPTNNVNRTDGCPSGSARVLLEKIIEEIGYTEVDTSSYGMLTADISDEKLLSLLNKEETEKDPVTEDEEQKAEKSEVDKENEDENADQDASDEDAAGDDTTETGDGETTGDDTTGTGDGETTGDTTTETDAEETTGDTTTETDAEETTGDTTTETDSEESSLPTTESEATDIPNPVNDSPTETTPLN